MRSRKQFEALAKQARSEKAPAVDVSDSVLFVLRTRRGHAGLASERSLMWVAALSTAAAVPAGLAAMLTYYDWVRPMTELMRSILWVTQ
jgi:hypothetical protein